MRRILAAASNVFDVRPGEGRAVVLTFLYVALAVAGFLLAKPIRNGLFLGQYGAYSLVYAYVAVPLVWENKVALLDAVSGEVVKQVPTGIAPFAAVIDRKGTTVWVSNLGGRPPKENELFASPAHAEPAKAADAFVDSIGVNVHLLY